jgi:DNA polymerase-4
MAALAERAMAFSPLAEPGEGDGHLFLDLSGTSRLLGPPADVAWRLRRQVRRELELDPIWTLGPNKLVAKAASRLVKPSGEYIVAGGEEAAFMAPLPLALVPGIEASDRIRLAELNLTHAGQVAGLTPPQLAVPCGRRADQIHEIVRGVDCSPVRPAGAPEPREEAVHLFPSGSNTGAELDAALYALVERVGAALRARRLAARHLALALEHADGVLRRGQAALQPATANDLILFAAARRVLHAAGSRRVRVRRLRLLCQRLVFPPAQVALFPEERRAEARREALVGAIDAVRRRFGAEALRLGRTLALQP